MKMIIDDPNMMLAVRAAIKLNPNDPICVTVGSQVYRFRPTSYNHTIHETFRQTMELELHSMTPLDEVRLQDKVLVYARTHREALECVKKHGQNWKRFEFLCREEQLRGIGNIYVVIYEDAPMTKSFKTLLQTRQVHGVTVVKLS